MHTVKSDSTGRAKHNNNNHSPIVCRNVPTNENGMTIPTHENRSHAHTYIHLHLSCIAIPPGAPKRVCCHTQEETHWLRWPLQDTTYSPHSMFAWVRRVRRGIQCRYDVISNNDEMHKNIMFRRDDCPSTCRARWLGDLPATQQKCKKRRQGEELCTLLSQIALIFVGRDYLYPISHTLDVQSSICI